MKIISELVPNLSLFFESCVTVPLSTITCERGFSKLALIKNKLRNPLEPKTIDRLMRISLLDNEKFKSLDLNEAYIKWEQKNKKWESLK